MNLLIRLGVDAVALGLTAWLLPGMVIERGFGNLVIAAAIFGLVNMLIGPILRLLTKPLTIVTLGLFTLVVNALLLAITTWIVDFFSLEGSFWERSLIAVAGALIITVISTILTKVFPDGKKKDG